MMAPNAAGLNITGPITVEAWIKTTSTAQQGIVERFNSYGIGSVNGGYALRLEGGRLKFMTLKNGAQPTGTAVGATPVTLGVWHHVAGVYDGSHVHVYLDGMLDASAPATAGPAWGSAETKIGTRGDSTALTRFNGVIDEVRITAGVVYGGGFTPQPRLSATSATRALWTFDARDGRDSSNYRHHLLGQAGVTFTSDVPGSGSNPPENQLPTVSMTATAPNGWTAPATIELAASATDSDGTVARVEFYADATKLGEDSTSPYAFTWSNVAAGSYSITARAFDNAGAAATSAPVAATVEAAETNQPPSVSVAAAAPGGWTAPATIELTATAADSDGTVARVEFYAGGTKLGEDGTSPYAFTWSNVAAGSYSVTARAIDDDDAAATSAAVNAVVVGSGGTPAFAAVMNGSASMMAPNAAGLNITGPITVEAWIKTTSTAQQGIVERFNSYGIGSVNGGYALRLEGGRLKFMTLKNGAEPTGTAVGATPVTLGVWHHVAGMYDGTSVHVYLDGVLDGSGTATAGPGSGGAETKIGTRGDSTGLTRFNGVIDEVRITAGVVYGGGFTPQPRLSATSATRALWTFDARDGRDSSNYRHHLLSQTGVTFTSDVPGSGSNPPENQPPTVSMTAAAPNGWTAPATIELAASASDADGTITRVEFYAGATKLGEDSTAPYAFTWNDVGAGRYSVTARAVDDAGAATTSTPPTDVGVATPSSSTVVKVMPLGDSLTYGAGHQLHQNGGYRIDLLQKLAMAGASTDFVGSVQSGPGTMSDRDNEGHNGWDTLEISGSVNSWLTTYTPQVILLLIGTNDIYENASGATVAGRLNALIGQIYGRLPNVSLIVASIPPLDSPKNSNVVAYNALIPGIVGDHAAAGRWIRFVDIYSVVSVADLVDGIHPGTAGYSKMATAWFDTLMEALAAQSPQQ